MSKKPTAAVAQPLTAASRFDAYSVRNYETSGETKSDWTRIGVAFPHADGKGVNVVLHALPLDGKLVLRLHDANDDSAG